MRPSLHFEPNSLTNKLSVSVRLVYNPSQAKADERALERAIETRDTLKPAADALHKIWETRLVST